MQAVDYVDFARCAWKDFLPVLQPVIFIPQVALGRIALVKKVPDRF